MRGYVEESPEVKAMGALKHAAKRYAAACLLDMFGAEAEKSQLGLAAEDYAKAVNPPKPVRKRKKA